MSASDSSYKYGKQHFQIQARNDCDWLDFRIFKPPSSLIVATPMLTIDHRTALLSIMQAYTGWTEKEH